MLTRNATNAADVIRQMKNEFGQNVEVSFIHLDLSMMQSVRRAAEEVLEKVSHIDALLCNAAISQIAKQEITIDGFESHMGVNYYGHFYLQAYFLVALFLPVGVSWSWEAVPTKWVSRESNLMT